MVGVDVGDRDDRVNPLFTGGEAVFDSGSGDNLFDYKGTKPFMI